MPYPPITEDEFNELVLNSRLPIGIFLTADRGYITDAAYREFLPVAAEFQALIAFFEADVVADPALADRLGLKAVPALLVFVSGIEVAALLGFHHRYELRNRRWSIIFDR